MRKIWERQIKPLQDRVIQTFDNMEEDDDSEIIVHNVYASKALIPKKSRVLVKSKHNMFRPKLKNESVDSK
jgi:hypothetical protein